MNYYKIFYWLTVADNARGLFCIAGIIFAIVAGIATIVNFVTGPGAENEEKTRTLSRKWMWWSYPFTLFLWCFYVFTPSKRDSLLILAGGGSMEFLTSDSSARQIPHELSSFVVSELKSMASEAKVSIDLSSQKEKILQSAKAMTTEQLVEKMKVDTTFARIILNK